MAATAPVETASLSRRKLIIAIIVASVVAHLLFGVVAGIWIVAKYLTQPAAVFDVKKTIIPPKKPEHRLDMEKVDSMAPAPTFNHKIQSLRPSKLALPDLPKIEVASPIAFDPKAMITTGAEGLIGMGAGSGTGFVFGTKISAKRLGVILDVSFSTHGRIHKAVEEIQKSFPDAILVLVPGTGMSGGIEAGRVMPADEFERSRSRLTFKGDLNSNTFLFEGFVNKKRDNKRVPGLLKSNQEFKRMYDEAKREKRLYNVFITPVGRNNQVTHSAINFLLEQGVDGIYWFADFLDGIDKDTAEEIISQLKAKGVKIYQQVLPTKATAPMDPRALSFSKRTGGEVIKPMQ